MIPIPQRFMTSTATVSIQQDDGEFADPVTISRVCFQGNASIRATDYQLQAPIKGVLIVDPRTSIGAFEIPAGSLVSIDGEGSEACVHDCIPVPSAANLHHWEVILK